jgi:hypothetical protein
MDVPIDPDLRIFVLSCGAPIQRRMGDGQLQAQGNKDSVNMDVPIDPDLRIFVLSCEAPIGDKTTKPFWATGKLMLPYLSSW